MIFCGSNLCLKTLKIAAVTKIPYGCCHLRDGKSHELAR